MDRQDRIPILEPLLLMLKQRTGVAVVLAFVVAFAGEIIGLPRDVTVAAISVIAVYIGGQKWVDGREMSNEVTAKVDKIVNAIEK